MPIPEALMRSHWMRVPGRAAREWPHHDATHLLEGLLAGWLAGLPWAASSVGSGPMASWSSASADA